MGLIADIQSDLEKGALQLMVEYRERLLNEAVKMCGDSAQAEDLVMRTIERVLQKSETYKSDDNLFGWMKTIMVNLHRDDLKSPANSRLTPVDPTTLEDLAGVDEKAMDAMMARLDHSALREAIDGLDPEYKQVLLLHFYEDLTVRDIAAYLNRPVGTVWRRIQVAIKLLSGKLNAEAKAKKPLAILAAFLLAGSLFGAWQTVEAVRSHFREESVVTESALGSVGSEGTLGSVGSEGSLEAAADTIDPNPDPKVPKDANSSNQLSSTENTEKEETMNIKSITKSAAKLAVGAALTTGFAANAVAEGDLPEGYTKLDYVETTGSQYLDTGYYPTPKSILEARIQMFGEKLNTTVGSIFAAKEDQWAFTVNYGGEGNVTELYCWFYKGYKMNGSGWTTVEKFSVGDNNGKIVDLSFDSTTGMFKYGTASRTCTRPVHTFTKCPLFFGADVNSANLTDGEGGLFSYFEASPFNYFRMRIYSLKLRDDELRRDYVPCQNERGEVGLYDRVNGTFSPSSSGVAFVPSENARFNVAVEVLGVGTVQVMADGEDVLGKSVPAGSTLDLSATPSEGYAFAGWSGNVFEKGYASDAETKTTRGISGAVCLTAVFLKVKDTWPADYERLEYVATTGTQYLVTGYCSNPSTRMDASVQMDGNPDVSKGVNIFGVREGRYSFTVNFGNTVETLDILRPWFDKLREAGGANRGFSGVNAFRGRRVSMGADATRGYFTYGDLTQSYCGPTTTWITGGSVVLAGFLNVDTGAVTPFGCYGMRIYGWSFSDGTTPMRDYVPCRRLADGVAGLYDRVSGTFCESSGEPFVAGDPWSGKEVVPSYVGYTPGEHSYDYVFTSFVPPLSDFTASVWVKNVTPGSFKTGVNECIGTIVSQGALSANNGFCCFVRQIGGETTQKLVFQTRAPYHELEIDWTAQATDDIWHLITLTYDRTTQNKRLYVDGVCVGEATVDVPSPVSTEGVAIGARLSGGRPDFPMKGYFAEASVWNRALSAKEVRAMLYGSLRGTEQGLIGYWPMTDDRRITPDRVANGNVPHDGIFTGGSKKLVEDKVGFHKRPGTMLLVW